jgi:hypothetical protein
MLYSLSPLLSLSLPEWIYILSSLLRSHFSSLKRLYWHVEGQGRKAVPWRLFKGLRYISLCFILSLVDRSRASQVWRISRAKWQYGYEKREYNFV